MDETENIESGAAAAMESVAEAAAETMTAAAENEEAVAETINNGTIEAAEPGAGMPECKPDETVNSENAEMSKEEPQELTGEEREIVRLYAVNDEAIRRAIIDDYLQRLKSVDPAPPVMQGDAGASPSYIQRAPRDMHEAAILAEALLRRK